MLVRAGCSSCDRPWVGDELSQEGSHAATQRHPGRPDRSAGCDPQEPSVAKWSKGAHSELGWVRVHKAVRFTGRVVEGTVSRTADRWLLGVAGEMLALPVFTAKTKPGGGGSRHFGTSHLIGWEKNAGPEACATVRKRRRLSKQFSRQMDASPASLSRKGCAFCGRQPCRTRSRASPGFMPGLRMSGRMHQLATALVWRFDVIATEDLNVTGMLRNRTLAGRIVDMGLAEFQRSFEYKVVVNHSDPP